MVLNVVNMFVGQYSGNLFSFRFRKLRQAEDFQEVKNDLEKLRSRLGMVTCIFPHYHHISSMLLKFCYLNRFPISN